MTNSPTPPSGPGGHGIVSDFGSLDGWLFVDADNFLRDHIDLNEVKMTEGGYHHYRFNDRSEIVIRANGEILRLPKPEYDSNGNRKRYLRLNIYTGEVMPSSKWHGLERLEQEWVVM